MENSLDFIDYIEDKYEILDTKRFIKEGHFKRVYHPFLCIKIGHFLIFFKVALQFPDELLKDAATVLQRLSIETNASFFILGDTSFGRY